MSDGNLLPSGSVKEIGSSGNMGEAEYRRTVHAVCSTLLESSCVFWGDKINTWQKVSKKTKTKMEIFQISSGRKK